MNPRGVRVEESCLRFAVGVLLFSLAASTSVFSHLHLGRLRVTFDALLSWKDLPIHPSVIQDGVQGILDAGFCVCCGILGLFCVCCGQEFSSAHLSTICTVSGVFGICFSSLLSSSNIFFLSSLNFFFTFLLRPLLTPLPPRHFPANVSSRRISKNPES